MSPYGQRHCSLVTRVSTPPVLSMDSGIAILIYGRIMTLSNLRFVSGSNGKNTGIYRAMPLRLVRVLQETQDK